MDPKEHFDREFEIRDAMAEYYSGVLDAKESGYSAKKLRPYVYRVQEKKLNFMLAWLVQSVVDYKLFGGDLGKKLQNLLNANTEATTLLEFHNKCCQFTYAKGEIPFMLVDNKISLSASILKLKSIKYQRAVDSLEKLQLQRFDSNEDLLQSVYHSLPHSIKRTLEGILLLQGYHINSPERKNVLAALRTIEKIADANGKPILKQVAELIVEKRICMDDLCVISVLQQNPPQKLMDELLLQLSLDTQKKLQTSTLDEVLSQVQQKLSSVKKVFNNIIEEANGKIAMYETSTDRLAKQFGDEILKEPISVTMVGVEYAGFAKEGGLAEAIEGLSQGLLKQHPDNKVRLIFPKFSLLPKALLDTLSEVVPEVHTDSMGGTFSVFSLDVNGVECLFIDDPSFTIPAEESKGASVYGGTEKEIQMRFLRFSSLAADLLLELPKPDIIHLHDWHVGGVAMKLRNLKEEVAPIVFTYHNNQRAAQGRYFSKVYNYEPVMHSLNQAKIASGNSNFMVEAVKCADAANTVSNTFAFESQSIERGEGVSFAIREAARQGKLSGIVNGTNVDRWDPETNSDLRNWKSIDGQQTLDLTYGPSSSDLLEKKQLCKAELQKWVDQKFPKSKFDCSKPLITYVGRYDSYQKGLAAFDEAIEATLKNGGQFICMGSLEDEESTRILDRIQKKYSEGVLVIRDYKTPEGKYYYQQTTEAGPGIGALVRAASDFTFIPSNFEPCGLVQFESWLFGAPVIAANVGGLADTVITRAQSEKNYNGYLFQRKERDGVHSLSGAIGDALQNWFALDPSSRRALNARLMQDGRKCSWNDAPSGYTPTEKYRFVYENARQMSLHRLTLQARAEKTFDISKYHRLVHLANVSGDEHKTRVLEEKYFEAYYAKDVEKLKNLYKQLPKYLRAELPSPYIFDANINEYTRLGAHYTPESTLFRVSAPNARSLFIQFFDSEGKPAGKPQAMEQKDDGTWAIDVRGIALGTQYQYLINGQPKIDPYGLEVTPVMGIKDIPRSKVAAREFAWDDQLWMEQLPLKTVEQPISIYELHPTSWKTKEGKYLNYRELAGKVVKHCKETGYTHVELMGILEHPDQRSFGYQVSNFFAPNSRMGTLEDFKYLVNALHENNIAVILDWIPAHFCIDDYALSKFDGTDQFEPSKIAAFFSVRYALTSAWGTLPFDYQKKEIRDFLLSSAGYWLKEMHIDGLRVDAVGAILYAEDTTSAKLFLRSLNDVIHKEFPGVITIAEDYSGSMKTTKATTVGGLGFDLKWHANWTKHILDYLAVSPKQRPAHYNRLIQAIEGDLFDKMVMAISHDEIMQSPLIKVTPDLTESQSYANLRSLFGLLMCLPGKKLTFMGSEIGADTDWKGLIGGEKGMMDVELTKEKKQLMDTVRTLNALYTGNSAFWKNDNNARDLEWIEKSDPDANFLAYRRAADGNETFACFHNFSVDEPKTYEISLKDNQLLEEVFNSNQTGFGGDGTGQNLNIQIIDKKYCVVVPPLSTVVVKEQRRAV